MSEEPCSGLIDDLVFKTLLILKAVMIFEKANKQNVSEQHFNKPDVHCQPLANLSKKPKATLR